MNCGIAVMAFSFSFFPFCAREGEADRGEKEERERDEKMAKAPLSCKFKCGRDVPTNLNVKRLDGQRHTKHGQGETGGKGRREAVRHANGQSSGAGHDQAKE